MQYFTCRVECVHERDFLYLGLHESTLYEKCPASEEIFIAKSCIASGCQPHRLREHAKHNVVNASVHTISGPILSTWYVRRRRMKWPVALPILISLLGIPQALLYRHRVQLLQNLAYLRQWGYMQLLWRYYLLLPHAKHKEYQWTCVQGSQPHGP